MLRDDQKCDVFKITKKILKTCQDITGEQCLRNDDSVLVAGDEDMKIAWKNYHAKLLNTYFVWDRNSWSRLADTASSIPHLIDMDMVRVSISKMKNRKAAGPSTVVSEMIVAVGEAGVDMITDLVNQIIVEEVIPAECELSIVVNCYKGKVDSLERGNYQLLKVIDQILKIADTSVGFMPG